MGSEAKVCRSCAKQIPDLEGIVYCPYCGTILEEVAAPAVDFSGKTENELLTELVKGKKSLDEIQKAAREKYENIFVNTHVKRSRPDDIYSLVLKACENKPLLIDCLNQVLTRGETAIRLAVTTMPAVLLYKVNMDTVNEVVAVLKDVDAVFAVVEGGFDYGNFFKSEQFTTVDSGGKAFLKNLPKTMWLGDTAKFISEDVKIEENKGLCVLSDNAFYFFPYKKGENIMILPAYRLETIDTWELDGRHFGEWVGNDGRTFRLEFGKEDDMKRLEGLVYDGLI